MPVFRIEKNRDYTTMSNIHLRDKDLSLKAKGLLSQMLSLPDEWNYSISGLAAINKESRDCIRTAICELEECGYIVRTRLRTPEGKLGDMEYVVYERPVKERPEDSPPISEEPTLEKPMLENPTQDKPTQANPTLENATELNTDVSNKDRSITEQSSKDGMKAEQKNVYGEYHNVHLSDSDIQRLKDRFPSDYGRRIERLSEYMESSGKTYRNHYLTICQWARRDEEKANAAPMKTKFENYECEEGESY